MSSGMAFPGVGTGNPFQDLGKLIPGHGGRAPGIEKKTAGEIPFAKAGQLGAYLPAAQQAAPAAGTDQVTLSPNVAQTMQYSRAQFEVNLSVMQAMQGENGLQAQGFSFSFKASFETLSLAAGGDALNPFAAMDGAGGAEGAEATDPLARLKEFFNPEKTAERILDFALSFFGRSGEFASGGDTEGSRGAFADRMGAAIQKGFDQALGILGQLPEEIASDIGKTHDLTFAGLDDFRKNGLDPAKMAGGNYMRAMQFSMSWSMSSVSISSGTGSSATPPATEAEAPAETPPVAEAPADEPAAPVEEPVEDAGTEPVDVPVETVTPLPEELPEAQGGLETVV